MIKNDGKSFGTLMKNGSFNGGIGSIESSRTDIVFVGYFIKDYGSKDIEFTVPAYQDRLCVMTRKAGKIPPVLLPLLIFDHQLWISFFLIYLVIATSWCVLRALNKQFIDHKSLNLPSHISKASLPIKLLQVFIDTSVLIFSSPFRRFSKVRNERILISSICLFSLIVIAAFQSSLSTVYTKPMFYKNIETLKELDKSGMRINSKYKSFLDDAFSANSSDLMDRLLKKVVWVQNESVLFRLENYGEAALTRKILFDLNYKSKKLHLISECARRYRIAYIVPKGFYFLEEVNEILLRIGEAGIVRKIIGLVSFKSNLLYAINNREKSKKKVFTLNDLQLAFYVLIIGYVISLLTFFLEIVVKIMLEKCSPRKKVKSRKKPRIILYYQ
jgi:hypothetical protein